MNTHRFVGAAQDKARAAQAEARKRQARMVELKKLGSAATMVFAGVFLAVLYCLLTHQIPV